MKVAAKVFKGIEYVQVNQLPENQRESFIQSVHDSLYIKILIDGKVVSGCVQYKDYERWYDAIFRPRAEKSPVSEIATSAVAV